MLAYADGDGRSDCPKCRGRGVYDYTPEDAVVPGVLTCECVYDRDIRTNMERGWRGLSTVVAPVEDTWLTEYADRNLWVTASMRTFKKSLYRVAYERGRYWRFQVSSDADMMDAWLSNIGTSELYDGDVQVLRQRADQVSNRFCALVDLVEPPDLLIISVSVKAARNVAMPEVLLEALQHRAHLDKPTWVVDLPSKPLTMGHIAYSDGVGEFLYEWDHYQLDDEAEPEAEHELPDVPPGTVPPAPKKRPPGTSSATWARMQREGVE